MSKKQKIAIVGATGAVGEELLNVLDELDFPVESILPLASAKSAGNQIEFRGKSYTIKELTEDVFRENPVDIAFFSAGGSVSEKYAKFAVEAGAVVIDNTSHFRMEKDVPLVVPECNPEDIKEWKKTGIIANPNCSTIQMVHILKPLNDAFDLKRVDVSTYQAASGAGKEGMEELVRAMQSFFAFKLDEFEAQTFPHTLALNLIPQIDVFMDNGYTKEELKMINFNPIRLLSYVFESGSERELVNVFAAVGNFTPAPDGDEVLEGRYWSPGQIEQTMGKEVFTPNFESEYRRVSNMLQALL